MWRVSLILGLLVSSLGATAGFLLVVMHLFEGEWKTVASLLLPTALFSWGTFACRRDLQRLRQEREFRAEIADARRSRLP